MTAVEEALAELDETLARQASVVWSRDTDGQRLQLFRIMMGSPYIAELSAVVEDPWPSGDCDPRPLCHMVLEGTVERLLDLNLFVGQCPVETQALLDLAPTAIEVGIRQFSRHGRHPADTPANRLLLVSTLGVGIARHFTSDLRRIAELREIEVGRQYVDSLETDADKAETLLELAVHHWTETEEPRERKALGYVSFFPVKIARDILVRFWDP